MKIQVMMMKTKSNQQVTGKICLNCEYFECGDNWESRTYTRCSYSHWTEDDGVCSANEYRSVMKQAEICKDYKEIINE